MACSPLGPGLLDPEGVSGLEDPGRASRGLGKFTLGLKRLVQSNLEAAVLDLLCSLSRLLRRGEGDEAERERRDLLWSLPCLSRAPCEGGAQPLAPATTTDEEEEEEDVKEEEEAEEEEAESVTDLAEAADLDASLEGLDERLACSLLEPDKNEDEEENEEDEEEQNGDSAFLRLWEEPVAGHVLLFLLSVLLAGGSDAKRRFFDLAEGRSSGAGSAVGSASSERSELSRGGALGRLAGLGE